MTQSIIVKGSSNINYNQNIHDRVENAAAEDHTFEQGLINKSQVSVMRLIWQTKIDGQPVEAILTWKWSQQM